MKGPTDCVCSEAISRCVGACALVLSGWMLSGSLRATELPLHVSHRMVVPSTTRVSGIGFDAAGAQAYLATGAAVTAFDATSFRQTDSLQLPAAAVAMAIDQEGSKGYAAIAAPAELVVFKLHPLHIESTIPLHDGVPAALLYASSEHALYVLSDASSTITRWDAASGKRSGQVRLSGALGQMATNARGTLYVANTTANAVDAVDEHSMKRLGAIPTKHCVGPTGLAMDPIGRRLFVSCQDGARTVIDTDMGFTFESFPTGTPGSSQMVFAMHPFGAGGWKGAAFNAGGNGELAGLRMNAFVNYSAGGTYALDGKVQAIALNVPAGQLWLALARPQSTTTEANAPAQHVELLVLTPSKGPTP
ncbi:MAG TPA: hypothetical protein VFE77_06245 [Rhodanobacter sp.]|nr:hypothetical protein [Rhodanobacter sp.]